jgi:cell division inhibitor SulA/protein ImuA
MLIVRPKNASEILWSAEQALSSGTCAAVLLWPETLDDQASRRLQLAAEKGRSWAIAFRPLAARRQNSAAALRLELHSNGEGTRVHILKSRGGRPTVLNNLI